MLLIFSMRRDICFDFNLTIFIGVNLFIVLRVCRKLSIEHSPGLCTFKTCSLSTLCFTTAELDHVGDI